MHLIEELPRVSRKRLDIFALALGVNGVERQRGLSRTAQASDYHQLITGNIQRKILEIMLTRAANPDNFLAHEPRILQLNNR